MAALLLTAATIAGCEEEKCLNQSYDATLSVVQEFNAGRCRTFFEGDYRTFDCPAGILVGEVSDRRFGLAMSASDLQYEFTGDKLQARCGEKRIALSDPQALNEIQRHFRLALAELDID